MKCIPTFDKFKPVIEIHFFFIFHIYFRMLTNDTKILLSRKTAVIRRNKALKPIKG